MVHTTCAVADCLSSSRLQRDKDLRFHQFPHSDERCKLWVEACKRPDLIGKPFESLKNTYLCSLHFEKGMYGKKSLKKTAVPTLCLPAKISIQTQTDTQLHNVITVKIEKELADDINVMPSNRVDSEEIKVEADVSLYEEGPFVREESNNCNLFGKHAGYQCNDCLKDIVGFRYTCVQCAGWDLCGACEARELHAAHYVLRVPSLRPYNEIQAVLAVIRQQLLRENIFFTKKNCEDSLKESANKAVGAPAPAAEPDPLMYRLMDSEDEGNVSEHYSPKHKKRRLQASDTDEISNSKDDDQATSYLPLKLTSHPRKTYLKPHRRAPGLHSRSTDNPRSEHKDLIEVTIDNIEVSDSSNNQTEVTDKTISLTHNRPRPEPAEITSKTLISPVTGTEESVVERNLEDDSLSEASNLQIPSDTDDAALAQALHSKAYVAMQPLRVQVQQLIFAKK